jgi:hypothetical protein
MEGMSFETPKGKMTFRKEDHQAMQSMYHFKIKNDPAFAWGVPELVREIPAKKWTFRSATSADVRRLRSGHASLRSAREPHVLEYVPVSAHCPLCAPDLTPARCAAPVLIFWNLPGMVACFKPRSHDPLRRTRGGECRLLCASSRAR